jgi:hypothetical protein
MLKAPETAIGKKAKCPACGTIMVVQKPLEVIEDDELPPAPKNEDPFGLGKLLDDEVEYQLQKPVPVAPTPEPETRRPCPACGEMIAIGAAKCRFCDEIFDHKRVKQAMKKARKTERVYDDDDLTGTEMLVAALCGGIGCIAGILWILQGKPKGWKMLGFVFLMGIFWTIVKIVVGLIMLQMEP